MTQISLRRSLADFWHQATGGVLANSFYWAILLILVGFAYERHNGLLGFAVVAYICVGVGAAESQAYESALISRGYLHRLPGVPRRVVSIVVGTIELLLLCLAAYLTAGMTNGNEWSAMGWIRAGLFALVLMPAIVIVVRSVQLAVLTAGSTHPMKIRPVARNLFLAAIRLRALGVYSPYLLAWLLVLVFFALFLSSHWTNPYLNAGILQLLILGFQGVLVSVADATLEVA